MRSPLPTRPPQRTTTRASSGWNTRVEHFVGWWPDPIEWPPFTWDNDRATGYLDLDNYAPITDALTTLTHIHFTILAFQAYRNGSGCDWHADTPFDAQAILSLGATRTLGIRRVGGEPVWTRVAAGDLIYMPPGFQTLYEHCVPFDNDTPGERLSLVFRTPRES